MNSSNLNMHLEAIIKKNGGTPNDWRQVSAILNSSPEQCKNFVGQTKSLLIGAEPKQQLIGLDLIDFVMVECGLPLSTQISSKDFITFILNLLKSKSSSDVQFKILTLIKKWGIRFEAQRDILPNFYETYASLKNSKVVFPDNLDSTYYQYLNSSVIVEKSEDKNEYPDFSNFSINQQQVSQIHAEEKISKVSPTTEIIKNKDQNIKQEKKLENNYGNVCLDLNPDNYPKKFKKFVSELITLLNYISLSNEMIDNSDYKKQMDEGIREMVSSVRDLDRNLQLAIENQIDHEGLMAICLGINDDIIKLLKRYDDLKAKRKPEPFLSSFHTDYVAYNLNYSSNSGPSKEYSGLIVNTGNNQVGANLVKNADKNFSIKKENSNLIDFSFPAENNISNSNNQGTSNINNSNQTKKTGNTQDINDIFDSFK